MRKKNWELQISSGNSRTEKNQWKKLNIHGVFNSSFFFFFLVNWSIVDLQCYVSFRCTAKWVSYTYLEKIIIQKDTCTPMFIAALFTIAKTWKQPECPSKEEWIKMWFIYTTFSL